MSVEQFTSIFAAPNYPYMKKLTSIIFSCFALGILHAQPQVLRTDQPVVKDQSVTFLLEAPHAKEVKVTGDFLKGKDLFGLGGELVMERDEGGRWSVTAKNLAPEFYYYYFLVDGVKTLDPWNISVVHNYKEHLNTFIIEGEESRPYTVADKHKGSLSQIWYPSSVIGCERRANVYLPYGYSSDQSYPVLYLQHGGGDDEETWVDMGRACQILDHLIDDGKAVPMIVVMPNSWDNQTASLNVVSPLTETPTIHLPEARNSEAFRSGGKWVDDLTNCLIPFIDAHYNVKPGKENRALAGLSMGGLYTLYAAQYHADLFSWWGVMGMGIEKNSDAQKILPPLQDSSYRLLWIGCGNSDMAIGNAKRLMKALDKREMPYVYYDSQDGHNWRSWRRDLLQFAPLLFK